jgi:hypothetical protein
MDKQRLVSETWAITDYALFSDIPQNSLTTEKLEEYNTVKGALLKNLFEMYHLLDYVQPDKCYNNVEEMVDYLESIIDDAKYVANDFVVSEAISSEIRTTAISSLETSKTVITEDSLFKSISNEVQRRHRQTILDSALILNQIRSCPNDFSKIPEFDIIYGTHKKLRDKLVDISLTATN